MSDDKSQKAPHDDSRIRLGEAYEVRYRKEELEISEVRFRQLMEDLGVSVGVGRSAFGR